MTIGYQADVFGKTKIVECASLTIFISPMSELLYDGPLPSCWWYKKWYSLLQPKLLNVLLAISRGAHYTYKTTLWVIRRLGVFFWGPTSGERRPNSPHQRKPNQRNPEQPTRTEPQTAHAKGNLPPTDGTQNSPHERNPKQPIRRKP